MKQSVIFSDNLEHDLQLQIEACKPDRLFVLTDENTRTHCWPVVSGFGCLQEAGLITIPAGDDNKNLDSLSHVWQQLQQGGATRHSLLVCLGGGMLTDLGGFAASTFKRGISFVNIPTTLLAMVDASVGGKTGINFGGLKNEVGVFSEAEAVIIDTQFLLTLDSENLLSGYAEMLKHGLISDTDHWAELLRYAEKLGMPDNPDIPDFPGFPGHPGHPGHPEVSEKPAVPPRPANLQALAPLLQKNVAVKERVVAADPHEQGLRKALNLGHTFGHALEEWSYGPGKQRGFSPLLHGYAVAHGLVCELYLSALKCGFPTTRLRQTVAFIRSHYGTCGITCHDYPTLLSLMAHDKKNVAGTINFTLLADIGDLRLNQSATDEEICEALDFLREG